MSVLTAQYLAMKVKALETMLPEHLTPERFLRVVFLQMQRNPRLAQSTKESIYASMMSAAEMGLMPDNRQGYLIPYRNGKTGQLEAQFQPSYMGIMDRARNSGDVADIYPASIRENDEFEYELGFDRMLRHRPNLRGNRGPIVAVYCIVQMKDGTKTFGPGPMTVDEVNAIRARSKSANEGPWVTDWEAQAWKTIIKRVLKFVPQSADLRGVIDADDADYTVEPERAKPATITDLMADAGAQEPGSDAITAGPMPTPIEDKTQSPPADPPEAPEWPKQDERGRWYDADGVYWDAGAHATPPKSGPPKVNEDGTFRARRGYTHLARDLAEKARQQRTEEPRGPQEDAPPAAGDGAGESDGGRSPGPGTTERGGRADGLGSEDQGDPLLTPTSVADPGPPVPGQGPSLQELGDMLAKAKTQDDFDEIESMAQQSLSDEEFSGFSARLVEQWKAWCARY